MSGFGNDFYSFFVVDCGTYFYDDGDGEYETLLMLRHENPGEICVNPTAVDARVVGDQTHYSQTGQILTVDSKTGLECVNDRQPNGICLDYEVRFCCPSKCEFIKAISSNFAGFNILLKVKHIERFRLKTINPSSGYYKQ